MSTRVPSIRDHGGVLIGRQAELATIAASLAAARIVTLTGPGGVGKTALAREAAAAWPAGDVHVAELAAFDQHDLDERVAGALGYTSFAELLAAGERRPLLVVLDNCEHVLDAAADLAARLADASAELRILATSRERLDLPEERTIRVDPLSTDGSPSPAASLFLEVAARRGLEAADDPGAVEELCRRLDGLPLALELAAARAAAMTAAEMVAHLDARLDLLARSRPRGPERHRSLSAAVAWSYQQLDRTQRTAFTRLAVFPAPFTLEMAAAVDDQAATVLPDLVERSLLIHEPARGTSWYRMLDTIRSFAAERLDDAGARGDAEARYRDLAADLADRLAGLGAVADFSLPHQLARTYRHLHRGVEMALDAGDRRSAVRLAAPMWWLEDLGHQSEAADLLERVLERWPGLDPAASAVHGVAAGLHRIAGREPRSRALATIAAGGSGVGAAYGCRTLGLYARAAGRWTDALGHFGAGVAAARAAGADGAAYEIEMHVGLTHARAGDLDRAIATLEAVVAAAGRYPLVGAWAGHFLAYVLLARDPARAAAIVQDLIPVGQSAEDRWIVGSAHCLLGVVALMGDDVAAAGEHAAAAIEAYHSVRNRSDIQLALLVASAAFVRRRERATAESALAAAQRYGPVTLGHFEADVLDDVGPLPTVHPGHAPLPLDEIVRRLRAADGAPAPPAAAGAPNRLLRRGDIWLVAFGGKEVHLRDTKGLADLARLVAEPGREIAALDLVGAVVTDGDAGPASDATARRQYEHRIRELQHEIDTAGDDARAARHREELDALVDHLTAAYGMGGRDRPQGRPAEKARTAVTWRIRAAIKRIAADLPALGDHLDRSVRTGRFCVYDPAEPVDWEV